MLVACAGEVWEKKGARGRRVEDECYGTQNREWSVGVLGNGPAAELKTWGDTVRELLDVFGTARFISFLLEY